MSLKRKAGELADVRCLWHPAKKAACQSMQAPAAREESLTSMAVDDRTDITGLPNNSNTTHPTSWPAMAAGQQAAVPASTAAETAAGEGLSEESPHQPNTTPPSCTDIVLYKAPTPLLDPTGSTAAHAIVEGQWSVLQQQPPNALAKLWRSLTLAQRRSLAGMWDAIRDDRMVSGLLLKLPPQQAAGAAAQSQTAAVHAAGSRPACTVEVIEDDQGSQADTAVAEKAALSDKATALNGVSIAAVDAGMLDDQQQLQASLYDGAAPMDMDV